VEKEGCGMDPIESRPTSGGSARPQSWISGAVVWWNEIGRRRALNPSTACLKPLR